MKLDFTVNVRELATQLGLESDGIAKRINEAVRGLSISTHAFVIQRAQENLEGWTLGYFLGNDSKNVRWVEVSPSIWVVEIDESVAFIEEGRPATFMGDWLLKPGAKGVKTAKDGSQYRVIPFTHQKGAGGKKKSSDPEIASRIKKELKNQGINLNKIERDDTGKAKTGIIHKLGINEKRSTYPQSLFSAPRNKETASAVGLKPSHGTHFLNNAVVIQREVEGKGGRKKTSKDVVTFRVISSKHKAEGRWLYPKIDPLNSIPMAYAYAVAEWEKIVKNLEQMYRRD